MNDQIIKTKKQIGGIVLLIAIIIITSIIFLRDYSFYELLISLKTCNLVFLILGFGMVIIFISCEAINIFMITKVLGQTISFRRCFQYSCIGFYFSAITPSASGGQPAQIYYMKKDSIPISLSSITIFFIVFVYQIAMIFMGIIMSITRYQTAFQAISRIKYLFLVGALINTAVIFILFSLMFSKKFFPGILRFLTRNLLKLRILKGKKGFEGNLERSMTSYHEKADIIKKHPILFMKVFAVTMLQKISVYMVPYLVYQSMGFRTASFMDFLTCQALLTISVSAIPLPGAEGVTQGGFLHLFAMFFSAGDLTSAMIINRALSFYFPLIFSFLMYLKIHIRTMNIKTEVVHHGKQ